MVAMTIDERVEAAMKNVRHVEDVGPFREKIKSSYSPGVSGYILKILDTNKLRVINETNGLDVDDCVILAQAEKFSSDDRFEGLRKEIRGYKLRSEFLGDYESTQLDWYAEERNVCTLHFDHDPSKTELDMEAMRDFSRNNNSFRFRYWAVKKHPEWFDFSDVE